ncbi:MAG: GntR family transcriptional regulator [Planctomycetota bacterium]|jgi:DNA-binding LacI/PurR family transcriptional regulator
MLKYQEFEGNLLKELSKLKPDEALPSIRELMKKYSVSLTTVNKAMGLMEEKGLIIKRKGAGVFANTDSANQTRDICVQLCSLNDNFSVKLVKGLSKAFTAHNLLFSLILTRESNPETSLAALSGKEKQLDLIIAPTTSEITDRHYIETIRRFQANKAKILTVDLPVPGVDSDFFGFDNFNSFCKTAEIFREKKCKNIALVGDLRSLNFPKRLTGVQEGIRGSKTKLEIIDIQAFENAEDVAANIKEKKFDGVIIAHVGYVHKLAEYLQGSKRLVAGIVEEGEILQGNNTITLEKPSIALGRKVGEVMISKREKQPDDTFYEFLS